MTDTITTTREAIESLVIRYNAFQEAITADDDNDIITWGQSLLDAQEAVGVEMCPPGKLQLLIEAVRKRAQVPA